MLVIDFSGEHSVQSVAELEQRLGVRFNDEENGFILYLIQAIFLKSLFN
jgi:hypothetical protein